MAVHAVVCGSSALVCGSAAGCVSVTVCSSAHGSVRQSGVVCGSTSGNVWEWQCTTVRAAACAAVCGSAAVFHSFIHSFIHLFIHSFIHVQQLRQCAVVRQCKRQYVAVRTAVCDSAHNVRQCER
jgi:hypothetical protein